MRMGARRRAGYATAIQAIVAALATAISPLAAASHDDGAYEQPLFFTWSRSTLDVLIAPPGHGQLWNGNGVLGGPSLFEATPCENSYLRAALEATRDWDAAIDAFGPPWLRDGLEVNVHVLGCTTPPPADALTEPEILLLFDEDKAVLLGVAARTRPCTILVSKAYLQSFSPNDMYNIAGHEYGHCLGLGHVGADHPEHDLMDGSYAEPVGNARNHRHCPSNLNVAGLEAVFAGAFARPGGGEAGSMPTPQYRRLPC